MHRMIVLLLLSMLPMAVHAQTPVESLSTCLADSTTGKDRKDLARWIFLAMAAHPEIRQYAAESAVTGIQEVNKTMAATFTRLLTESCPQQVQAAFKEGGAAAIQVAFQTLGQLAMQELMSDPQVNASMAGFQQQLDQNRINKLFEAK